MTTLRRLLATNIGSKRAPLTLAGALTYAAIIFAFAVVLTVDVLPHN